MWKRIGSVLAMVVSSVAVEWLVDRSVAKRVVARRRDLIVMCNVLEIMMVAPKTIRLALTTMKVTNAAHTCRD